MMDWEDLGDWIMWGMLASAIIVMAATAVVTLVVLVHHAVRYIRGRKAAPPPSIEELLASIPGVAYYRELPPGPGGGEEDAADDERRERCAICVTNYEDGEACSVLPGCAHMFHKPCVANWLRKKNTCPLCRATVGRGVPAGGPPPLRGVENMV
ncbi:unnamed protein product [Urochloa decumbens]|uniref:RING-type domain-containing protein n=1 Tax=Urochloa decumbens TaxID=240449 RepID=A0ABC9FS45_9POAL